MRVIVLIAIYSVAAALHVVRTGGGGDLDFIYIQTGRQRLPRFGCLDLENAEFLQLHTDRWANRQVNATFKERRCTVERKQIITQLILNCWVIFRGTWHQYWSRSRIHNKSLQLYFVVYPADAILSLYFAVRSKVTLCGWLLLLLLLVLIVESRSRQYRRTRDDDDGTVYTVE